MKGAGENCLRFPNKDFEITFSWELMAFVTDPLMEHESLLLHRVVGRFIAFLINKLTYAAFKYSKGNVSKRKTPFFSRIRLYFSKSFLTDSPIIAMTQLKCVEY